jgi:RHS repeat-associated protein
MLRVRAIVLIVLSFLLVTTTPLVAGTALEIAPQAASPGARFVVAGSGLDTGTLVITFASAPTPAQIVSRTATVVEGVVPSGATTGSVNVSQDGATIGKFSFTVSAPPAFGRVATLAASDKGHDVLKSPAGVAVITATGTAIVADTAHHRIVSVSGNGTVSLLAGSGKPGQTDGSGATAQFKSPGAVAVDEPRQLIYVADTANNVVRRITFSGLVSTLAGSGRSDDGDGTGTQASFKQPGGIAVDAAGNVYVADTGNSKVRMISPAGVVRTIAGGAHDGFADGPALQALFKQPAGIAVSATGVVFIGDTKNNVIRKLENGAVTTIAGTGHSGYLDGNGPTSEFKEPAGLCVDDAGNVYVADTKNNAIRRIVFAGTSVTVTTLAGGGRAGFADGDPATAQLSGDSGIALAGALYVADTNNDAVRVILPMLRLAAVYPHGGPTAGGNDVRIFGTGFLPGATTVTFGTTAAPSVTFVSSTEVVAKAPAGSGTVDVKVTTGGVSETLAAAYSYLQPPTMSAVQPAKGMTAGGTSVTVTGTNFVPGQTSVTIGGAVATVVSVSSNSLTAVTPANVAGAADVAVTTPTGSATLPRAFTYFAPPVITSFAPSAGSAGTVVTITGQNFDPDVSGDQVLFGTLSATVQSASAAQLVVVAPAGVSTGKLTVTTAGGSVTSAADFSTSTVAGLAVSAPVRTLDAGSTLQLNALGLLANGGGIDVTARAGWSGSGSGGNVSSSGLVTATAAGGVDITAVLGTLSATYHLDVQSVRNVPDPVAVAPKNDLTVVQPLADQMRFLYSGASPIQTGVAAGAIDDNRVTAVRGFVRTAGGAPLVGVQVSVLAHPEYGQTATRADGGYELALNGGGAVSLQFAKNGYLPVQRLLVAQWQERKVLQDVVLTGYDSQTTKIAMAATASQIARASLVSDSDGLRRATLVFPAATTATLVMADGSTQPAPALTVRASELTVGASGKQAMPAALPATSGYTYCVDLTADEATSSGAVSIQFSRPVAFYAENFLGLPVGTIVPVGYYDRTTAAWKASANGVVLKVLSVSGGTAAVDTDGDGIADAPAILTGVGIDSAELQQLASLYGPGQTLWRFAVTHFTPFDANLPIVLPFDATTPGQPGAWGIPASGNGSCPIGSQQSGYSIVECSNQTLGESVAITGTPYSLEYVSSRAARSQYKAVLHLSGASVPASLQRIDLAIVIAGRSITQSFPPQTNLDYTFVWDGLDAYGRAVQGVQTAFVTIDYVYPNYYGRPTGDPNAWARPGDGTSLIPARSNAALSQSYQLQLGHFGMQNAGFGGWTLNAQQFYDSSGRTIYEAGGTQRAGDPDQNGQVGIYTVAGNADCCNTVDGAKATQTPINFSYSVAPAPEGSFYFIDSSATVWHVDTQGVAHMVAGKYNVRGFTPDGQPALGGALRPWDIAVGPDGALYINDQSNGRVRKVVNGFYVTVAGNGTQTQKGIDGQRATDIGIDPQGIAVGPDNTLYIADAFRVLRVGTDGIATKIAGDDSFAWQTPDGIATKTGVAPLGVAVGPEGSVYISDSMTIRRITPDGLIRTIAGTYNRNAPFVQDGQPATSGLLPSRPNQGLHLTWGFSVAPDGTVVLADLTGARVLAVSPDGILTTVAGTGKDTADGVTLPPNGLLARSADVDYPWDVKVAPDGSLLIADYDLNVIRRTTNIFPSYRSMGVIVPSGDGTAAFWFDSGRHTKTIDTLTGVTQESFTYDAHGLLTAITDLDGNVTTIERDGHGDPDAIVAPGGQRTTLTMTGGNLASVTNPSGESFQFLYDGSGLLTQTTDRRGGLHTFSYDADGLLTKDAGPDGGFIALVRSGVGDNYAVTKITAEGRTEVFSVALPGQTAEQRTHVRTDGLSELILNSGATSIQTSPDGSRAVSTLAPDTRFGMLAPISNSQTLKLGAQTLTVLRARSTSLADPLNPLSLLSMTETTTINGATWISSYDAAAHTLVATSPRGRRNVTVLDTKGRVVSTASPSALPTQFTYDATGQLMTLQQGARTVTLTHDTSRRLASVKDSFQRAVTFGYDNADRIISQIFADGRAVTFAYDAAGNLASITPPNRPPHSFAYTPADLTASYTPPTLPDGGATQYAYNKDRALTLVTKPDGLSIGFSYDTAGRLAATTIARGQYSYGYNASGQLATAASPDTVTLAYGYNGPLISSIQWGGEAPSIAIGFTYDNNLRLSGETLAGNTVIFSYDQDNLITGAGAFGITRDAQSGFPTAASLDSINDTWSYDQFGAASSHAVSSSGTDMFSQQFVRNDAGQITQKTEAVLGGLHSYGYSYDAMGRLQNVTTDGDVTSTYNYDANGNRLARTSVGSTEIGSYDDQDRLLSYGPATYTYTASGDLSSKTDTTGFTSYAYDEMGNLIKVVLPSGAVITYTIDAENHRVAKAMNGITLQRWIYDGSLRVAAELDSAGGVESRFIYATRANVPDYMIRGGLSYRIITDHLGSPRLVLETVTGTVMERIDYDEWGRVVMDTNPGWQPFGFAGGFVDRHTGLISFGARDYDPQTGRWVTKDQIGFRGADTNLYVYTWNDPINLVDPLGESGYLAVFSATDQKEGWSMEGANGHSWISYTPDDPSSSSGQGATTEYSTWSGMNTRGMPGGLNENAETRIGLYQPTAARFAHIDDAGEKALMRQIDRYRRVGWSYDYPCSAFAHDAWEAATGENLHQSYAGYSNPTSLNEGIKAANHGKPFGQKGH